jgi:hypothetical protein
MVNTSVTVGGRSSCGQRSEASVSEPSWASTVIRFRGGGSGAGSLPGRALLVSRCFFLAMTGGGLPSLYFLCPSRGAVFDSGHPPQSLYYIPGDLASPVMVPLNPQGQEVNGAQE